VKGREEISHVSYLPSKIIKKGGPKDD